MYMASHRPSHSLRATTPLLTIVGMLGTLWPIIFVIWSFQESKIGAAFVFLSLTVLGCILLIFSGTVELNSERITFSNLTGRYQISWDDITSIEIAAGNFVLNGHNKRLAMPAPGYWYNRNRKAMLALLRNQMEQRGIELMYTPRATFKLSRNTRVKRG